MSKRIPRHCDEMLQVGPVEADELAVILSVIFIGIATDNLLYGLLAAFFIPKVLAHFKGNNPRGFLIHCLYWWGITDFKKLFCSNSYMRHWVK